MEVTVFNPVQQHLLKFFAFDGSEEKLLEMKAVLTKYFSQKLDKRLDELWAVSYTHLTLPTNSRV